MEQFKKHLAELFRLLDLLRVGGLSYERAFKLMVVEAEHCIRISEQRFSARDVAQLCEQDAHARRFFDCLSMVSSPRRPEPPEADYAI